MQFVKQPITLSITNIDVKTQQSKNVDSSKHSVLFPNNIRCIIKTNIIISLIEDPNGLIFENIYLYSMSLYQPKYVYLREILGHIEEIGFHIFSSNDDHHFN